MGVIAGVARDPQPGFPSFSLGMRQEWKVGEEGELGLVAGHSGVSGAGVESRQGWWGSCCS